MRDHYCTRNSLIDKTRHFSNSNSHNDGGISLAILKYSITYDKASLPVWI